MNTQKLRNYFDRLKNETGGNNASDSNIIDWEDGTSMSMQELEEEYYKYREIYEDISDYIDDNDLDDTNRDDYKKIVKYSETLRLNEDYFDIEQACLIDFIPYMIKKLNK